MTRKRLMALRAVFSLLSRQAEVAGASDWFDRAYDAEVKAEREHRAFGARFTRGAARYHHSVADAARYFVCKWVIEGAAPPKSWADTCVIRDAARLGCAVHEKIEAYRREYPERDGAGKDWPEFTFDYTEDIAAGCENAAE